MTQLLEILPGVYALEVPMDLLMPNFATEKSIQDVLDGRETDSELVIRHTSRKCGSPIEKLIIDIPPGNWSIICCSLSATEAEAAKVVDSNAWGWEKYLSVKNKKEQLNMLIRSKGLDDKLNWLILKLD